MPFWLSWLKPKIREPVDTPQELKLPELPEDDPTKIKPTSKDTQPTS